MNLPYEVYRPNPRDGFAMSDPTLREHFSGTHDAVVKSAIWRTSPEVPERDQEPEPRREWALVYQMEDFGLVPEQCPWFDVTVEYKEHRRFFARCAVAGNLADGTPIYRSESESDRHSRPTYYSVRLGKDLRRTLLVIEFDSDFDESELSQLLPMLENMRRVSTRELISALD